MISFEPLPLLEAYAFLTYKYQNFSIDDYFDKVIARYSEKSIVYNHYRNALKTLFARLSQCLASDESDAKALFSPLKKNEPSPMGASMSRIADILIQDTAAFCITDPDSFFKKLNERAKAVPNIVVSVADPFQNYDSYTETAYDAAEIFRIVNSSKLPQSSKLLLVDTALNANSYIDKLRYCLLPVASEFSNCRDIWQPLLDVYNENFSDCTQASEVISRNDLSLKNSEGIIESCSVYPIICDFRCSFLLYPIPPSNDALGFMGVLYSEFKKGSSFYHNERAEVSRVMEVLGDQTRFDILSLLADGPSYGRELAKSLNISTSTVSQHLLTIAGAKLVTQRIQGRKIYYSLDKEQLRKCIGMLSKILLKE